MPERLIDPAIDLDLIAQLEAELAAGILDIDLSECDAIGLDLGGLTADDLTLETQMQTRIHAPEKTRLLHPRLVVYDNAKAMAADIGAMETPGQSLHAVVSGNFIAGDFIEAWIVASNWLVTDLHVATLSISQANIDSLANLLHGDFVRRLHLLASDYWYAHERHNNGLLPYAYQGLDLGGDRFQLAVANSHAKITLIATATGGRYVLHGSANLRSSASIEQIAIEHDAELYAFHLGWIAALEARYSTIHQQHPGRTGSKRHQWQTVEHSAKSTTPDPAPRGKRKTAPPRPRNAGPANGAKTPAPSDARHD